MNGVLPHSLMIRCLRMSCCGPRAGRAYTIYIVVLYAPSRRDSIVTTSDGGDVGNFPTWDVEHHPRHLLEELLTLKVQFFKSRAIAFNAAGR